MKVGDRGLRLIAIALIVFGATGMAVALLKSRPDAGYESALSLSADSCDLGDSLRQGQKYSVSIEVANHGDAELRILRFESDCGCTLLMADKKTLLPGEQTTIKAQLDTGTNRGSFARHCAVIYRQGERPDSRRPFVIRGRIVPEFEVSPAMLSFDRSASGSQIVSFAPRDGAQLDVQVKGVSADGLSAVALPEGIEVTFNPRKYNGGQGVAKVFVATGNPVESHFTIDVVIR